MGKRRKDLVLENVLVETVAAEGKSLAHHDGFVVFIQEAVPGDVIDLRVTKKKSSFMEGVPVKYHELSKLRVNPVCDHFGVCGGCKWQHLNYESQLKYKHQQVVDALQRIAKVELPEISPIIRSVKTEGYRNKLEFTFSNKKWLTKEQIDTEGAIERSGLGFHIPRLFDKVVDVETCHLMGDPCNAIKNEIRSYALKNGLTFFDLRDQYGLLRNLLIRQTDAGEVMVIVQFFEPNQPAIDRLMKHIAANFPTLDSLLYVINEKKNDTLIDQEIIVFAGKDHIIEKMGDHVFKIGPKSFYQTNSAQAKALYDKTLEFADFKGHELVYDLYTGTGTIANYCAKQVKKVIGLEYVEDAIKDAFVNSAVNGITNTDFFAGDMRELLNDQFIAKNGHPDIIITDPPRAGMHEDVVKMILKVAPEKVVYVSCNPATQARDVAMMDHDYKVMKVQPVDMFPHTHHVENIVLMVRRDLVGR